MATLATSIALSLRATLSNALDLSTPKDDLSYSFSKSLTTGTGLDSADKLWHDQRTLSATSSETLDLAGSLTDGLGATATFVKIKGIVIENTSTTSGCIIQVGGNASNAFVNWVADATDKIKIGPGGLFVLFDPSLAGYGVTASTGDILKIENLGGSSVTYNVMVIGTSA